MTPSADELVTNADARARGIGRGTLYGKNWKTVYRGVHAPYDTSLDLRARARAALSLHPADAHLSHATVAELLGVPIDPDDEVHVTVHHRRDRRYRPGLRPHYRVRESTCMALRGLPVSDPLQMFVELAGSRSLVDTVIAGDYLVRNGFFTRAQLLEFVAGLTGKHSRKARRAARWVRDGVDSPMETRLRLLLVLAGLPEPTINHRVYDDNGTLLRRFDLCYPQWRTVIEYDGRQHIEIVEHWESDLDRREELDLNDWRVVPIIGRDIFRRPDRTIARVVAALESRGAKVPALKDHWRAHFPVR